jgi:hypothetical protein
MYKTLHRKLIIANKNGQSRDTDNIGHTRMNNPETLTPVGIQEWTIQRH